jgi:hypothetical protein
LRRDELSELTALQKQIETAVEALQEEHVGQVPAGKDVMGNQRYETDQAALAVHNAKIDKLKALLVQVKQRMGTIRRDPLHVAVPTLKKLAVGEYGVLDESYAVRVFQVIDDANLIVAIWIPERQDELEATKLWLSGFDTTALTDDSGLLSMTEPLAISTTKRYTTVAGSTSTVLYAERFQCYDYVEIVSDDSTRVPLRPALAVTELKSLNKAKPKPKLSPR